MAERSSAGDIGFGVVGAALGLGLIFVAARYLAPRRADAQEPAPPPGGPVPSVPPSPGAVNPEPPQAEPPPPPAGPSPGPQKDESRLTFTMVRPGLLETAGPMLFAGPDMRTYSLREMIERIKAGGRFDVTLVTSSVRPASADYARAFLFLSGIFDVWDEEGRRWTLGPDSYLVETTGDPDLAQYRVPPDKSLARVAVSGNPRGHYGRWTSG